MNVSLARSLLPFVQTSIARLYLVALLPVAQIRQCFLGEEMLKRNKFALRTVAWL
jgi:hypothetical protein